MDDSTFSYLVRMYFLFYKDVVLPKIRTISEVTQNDYGYHGLLTHTEAVVFRGIYFAVSMGKNPIPVIFACACHDLARTNNEYCELHGPNGVPIVEKLVNMFGNLLTDDEKEKVKFAVEYHTVGKIAPDYISACLWDADRARLSWECGYNEKFFNTDVGKKVSSGNPKDFLKFWCDCLGYNDNLISENIFY